MRIVNLGKVRDCEKYYKVTERKSNMHKREIIIATENVKQWEREQKQWNSGYK